MNKAIFIDKDGTLIKDVPYNVNPALIKLENDVGPALKVLQQEGFKLFIISNQSGVARGYFKEDDLNAVSEKINEILSSYHVDIAGFYYCPHHPEGVIEKYAIECDCRKPKAGLIIKASEENAIDVSGSWMIGDILNDVEAGNKAGCKTILIDNGNETEWIINAQRQPTYMVKNFKEAAEIILQSIGSKKVMHAME